MKTRRYSESVRRTSNQLNPDVPNISFRVFFCQILALIQTFIYTTLSENPVNSMDLEKVEILSAGAENLAAIRDLASRIWREYYPAIISDAQIDYMLAQMYSHDTLRAEITEQGICYDRMLVNGRFVGFASYGPAAEPGVMKLHKLYLLPELHGRGLGSLLLRHCEREARKRGARRLILTVNKRNTRAITAYQRNGFRIAELVVTDIGSGFVMDDFVMVLDLPPRPR